MERAARLIAVCDFDAINSEIVASAEKVLVEGRVKSELHCLARINDPDLCRQFRIHSARRDEKVASLDFLNIDDVAARYLLDEFHFDKGCTRPHILVAHLDPLGQWLVVQTALDWQVTDHGDKAPLHVSVLDDDAERRISSLSAEHPYAARVCTFHHASLSAGGMRDLLLAQQASPDIPPINYAFVTAFRDEHGLETAMKLQHQIESLDTEVPIVAALSRSHGVSSLVHDAGRHRQDGDPLKIKVFQTLEHACTTDVLEAGLMETTLARHIHDKWRDMMKDEPGEHPEWDEAGELDRESSRAQARDIPFKLRRINCMIGPLRDNELAHQLSDSDIETLARDEHNRWWKEHIAAGWSYAEKKCKKTKQHPDMRPYDQLSRSDGDKDVEFMRAIPDLLAKMNLRIVERPAEPNGPSNGRRSPLGWFRRQRPGG